MIERVRVSIEASIAIKQQLLAPDFLRAIHSIGQTLANVLASGQKILICGNGGSAADAQHIAAELVGRFWTMNRRGLPAISLSTDTSALTAIANDFGFEHIFSRQLEALLQPGDAVIGISTSGNSPNVLNGLKTAQKCNAFTIGLLGGNGGSINAFCLQAIIVPTNETPRIQEAHIMIGHIWCDIIEQNLFAS